MRYIIIVYDIAYRDFKDLSRKSVYKNITSYAIFGDVGMACVAFV